MMRTDQALQLRSEYWALLGGVRFGLAAIVLCHHLILISKVPFAIAQLDKLSAPTAVYCFLVLSGYSIAHSLTRDPHQFYRRRLLRLYPLYFLTIIAGVVLAKLPGSPVLVTPGNVLANLLFLQTFITTPMASNPVLWSLGVEAVFYLMAPFLQKMSSSKLIILAGISALAFIAFPMVFGTSYFTFQLYGLPTLILGWMWLAGFIYYRHQDQSSAGLLLIGAMISLTTLNQFFALSWQHITIMASLGLLVGGRAVVMKSFAQTVLEYLGNLSYPLYLTHMLVFAFFRYSVHVTQFVLVAVTSMLIAMVALFIEPKLRAMLSAAMDSTDALIARHRQSRRRVAQTVAEDAPVVAHGK